MDFCLDGSLAVALACTSHRVRAVTPYYGFNAQSPETLRRNCPVVGSYPERDLTRRQSLALSATLDEAGIPNDIQVYSGTHLSFPTQGPAFDSVAAEDAWNRMMVFCDEHITGV